MKTVFAAILVALYIGIALPMVFTGCESLTTTAVQSNETVVVNAEKTLRISKDTFDLFLKLEYQNQDTIKSQFPQIHEFANYIRKNAPDWLLKANNLKNQYKHGQGTLAALQAALSVLTTNTNQAQTYINEINKR